MALIELFKKKIEHVRPAGSSKVTAGRASASIQVVLLRKCQHNDIFLSAQIWDLNALHGNVM